MAEADAKAAEAVKAAEPEVKLVSTLTCASQPRNSGSNRRRRV